jgi:hypothetical protein
MRIDRWDERFFAVMQSELARPFSWHGACCMSLVSAVMTSVRGDGYRFPVDLDWTSELTAYKRLKTLGFETVADAIAAHLPEIAVLNAGRADIGMLGNACLVCIGPSFVGRSEQGLISVPLNAVSRAFRT